MKGIKLIKPVRGFSRQHQSGVITVARSLNPTAPYRAAAQIPDYLSLVDKRRHDIIHRRMPVSV